MENQGNKLRRFPIETLFEFLVGKTYEQVISLSDSEFLQFLYDHLNCEECPLYRKCEEPPYKDLDGCFDTLKMWFYTEVGSVDE